MRLHRTTGERPATRSKGNAVRLAATSYHGCGQVCRLIGEQTSATPLTKVHFQRHPARTGTVSALNDGGTATSYIFNTPPRRL